MHSFYRRPSGPAAFLYSVAVALVALAPVRAPAGDDSREFAAARGDRSSGWLAQSRSEVLARNGIVTTSQPLAAQAGLQTIGTNIDAER